MKSAVFLVAAVACAQPVVPVDPALAEIAATHRFLQAAISPDGAHVAYVEALAGPGRFGHLSSRRARASRRVTARARTTKRRSPGRPTASSSHSFPTARRRSSSSFTSRPADGGPARQLTHLKGLLAEPRWSPDGKRIAILFTENLPHAAGPLDPVPPDSGVLGSQIYEQRLTVGRRRDGRGAPAFAQGHVHLRVRLVARRPHLRGHRRAGRGRRQLVDRAALHHAGRGRRR